VLSSLRSLCSPHLLTVRLCFRIPPFAPLVSNPPCAPLFVLPAPCPRGSSVKAFEVDTYSLKQRRRVLLF
jgi:hypothetical protein